MALSSSQLARFTLLGALTFFLGGCQSTEKTSASPLEVFREIGYEDAVNLSAAQAKPLFIFFDGDWAKDRDKLLSRIFSAPRVAALLNQRTIALRVEVIDLPDITKKYRVATVPQLVLLSPDGHEINRWSGVPKAEAFTAELDALLSGASALQYQHTTRKSRDLVERHQFATHLIAAGQYPDALEELLWLYHTGIGEKALVRGKLKIETVITSLGALKALDPTANEALISLCEQEKQTILRLPNHTIAGRKLAQILLVQGNLDASLATFRELPPGKARDIVKIKVALPAWVKKRDYESAAKELSVAEALREMESYKEISLVGRGVVRTVLLPLAGSDLTGQMLANKQQTALQNRAFYFELYAGANRVNEARQIATAILKWDRLKQAPAILYEAAQKACGDRTNEFLHMLAVPELMLIATSPNQPSTP